MIGVGQVAIGIGQRRHHGPSLVVLPTSPGVEQDRHAQPVGGLMSSRIGNTLHVATGPHRGQPRSGALQERLAVGDTQWPSFSRSSDQSTNR